MGNVLLKLGLHCEAKVGHISFFCFSSVYNRSILNTTVTEIVGETFQNINGQNKSDPKSLTNMSLICSTCSPHVFMLYVKFELRFFPILFEIFSV